MPYTAADEEQSLPAQHHVCEADHKVDDIGDSDHKVDNDHKGNDDHKVDDTAAIPDAPQVMDIETDDMQVIKMESTGDFSEKVEEI